MSYYFIIYYYPIARKSRTCATGGPQIWLPASGSQTQRDLICISAPLLSREG